MDKRQRPDVNKTGHTYKQIYKNWGGYATEDELKLLWGERVKGKTNYRLRNLTPDQYLEALSLYKKITGKPHADGGMVSRTFAIAYLLERKGELVNWMSFGEQHQLEKQQKGLQNNILQEEALEGKASEEKASCNAKHKHRELSPQESPQEDEDESEESKKHRRKTKTSRVGASDVTTDKDKHTSEFRKTVITWVDSTTQALKIAKLELNESIRNQKELERKVELLNQDKSMIERDLAEWSELIKKQPDTAAGVKYVSELKEKQLNDKILPELRFFRKKLQDMEMHTKLNTEEVSQLEPRLQRFIMCIKDFESPYSLEPSLPPIPLATELDGDIGCPYCGRSIIWEGLPLPVVVAECSHRYHIPCLSSHLRHIRRCCYYACNHDMSNIWLQSFGMKVTPPEEHKLSLFNINDAIAKKTTEMRMDTPLTTQTVETETVEFVELSTPKRILEFESTTPQKNVQVELDAVVKGVGKSTPVATEVQVEDKADKVSTGEKRVVKGSTDEDSLKKSSCMGDNMGAKSALCKAKLISKDGGPTPSANLEPQMSSSPTRTPSVTPSAKITRSSDFLLVFDFNGVLGQLYDHKAEVIPSAKELGVFVNRLNNQKTAIFRPDLRDFLKWCFSKFKVALWSNMAPANLKLIVQSGLPDFARHFLFKWSQVECTKTNFTMKSKPILVKELSKVYKKFQEFGVHNTLLIDDSMYKSLGNKEHTTICPNTFDPSGIDGKFLMSKLKVWMEGLLREDIVQSYVERNPMYNVFETEDSQRAAALLQKHWKKG